MPVSLIALCLWALAAAAVATLPMRFQRYLGLGLLAMILPLLIWVGFDAGWGFASVGLFAFLSMFRKPLRYLLSKVWAR